MHKWKSLFFWFTFSAMFLYLDIIGGSCHKHRFCRDKSFDKNRFVATKLLWQQKWYLRQLLPMIVCTLLQRLEGWWRSWIISQGFTTLPHIMYSTDQRTCESWWCFLKYWEHHYVGLMTTLSKSLHDHWTNSHTSCIKTVHFPYRLFTSQPTISYPKTQILVNTGCFLCKEL